jgi:hypothetical protein
MVRVMREAKFRIHRGQRSKLASRTEQEKSNVSLRGEYLRHKKPVKLAPLKFLEQRRKDEEPESA